MSATVLVLVAVVTVAVVLAVFTALFWWLAVAMLQPLPYSDPEPIWASLFAALAAMMQEI